ncbi:MAG: T9SS type A sorting domain-containing protein [Ignavibacteriaceae bacterium]|nr:T9SS type A sorting domain-containing protein [Ignavibacteriaceae bacterium]
MYKTSNGGGSIFAINNGINYLLTISINIINDKELIVVGSNDSYYSVDNGEHWYSIHTPYMPYGFSSIEKVGEGYFIIASRNGIYRNSTPVSVANENFIFPNNFSLHQNYPNPFNPTTTIKYTIPDFVKMGHAPSLHVNLIVYDMLGNEITTLVNEAKVPGEYEVVFDAGKYKLSSGVYFYRLTYGTFIETKKMCVLK